MLENLVLCIISFGACFRCLLSAYHLAFKSTNYLWTVNLVLPLSMLRTYLFITRVKLHFRAIRSWVKLSVPFVGQVKPEIPFWHLLEDVQPVTWGHRNSEYACYLQTLKGQAAE